MILYANNSVVSRTTWLPMLSESGLKMKRQFYQNTTFLIAIVYLLVVSVYLVWHRAWFAPDQFFAVALILTVLLGRVKQFIQDWSLPLILLFGYECLRGLVPILGLNVNIYPMINFDTAVFGVLPTIKLQNLLTTAGIARWYDYMAVVLYISHFIIPMFIGFLFWFKSKASFKDYSLGLLILSYAAFITYIFYPAMPPWMASQQGFIPPIQHIMDTVMLSFGHPITIPTIYQFFGANLVAAVPSLHAAYPWLNYLFVSRKIKVMRILLIPYVAGVWFSVVYLGEHYIFDVVIGIVYATVAYTIVDKRVWLKQQLLFWLRALRGIEQPKLGYEEANTEI
jgi:hypothetical protein